VRQRSWFDRHRYGLAGSAIFLFLVVSSWTSYVDTHEAIYLLGSRRVVDPQFLAADFTWSKLPPTTFLYDHAVALLWAVLDEFAIVNLGRILVWGLVACSLAVLGRTLRLPAWSLVAGFALWHLWGETLAQCGSPVEGFQVKSLSYPLIFFALAYAVRGQVVRAGLAAGLATALHIIIGGWGCLALFLSLVANRKLFTWRQVVVFLLATAPLVLPLVLVVGLFHGGQVTAQEQGRMDEIYVTFAAPHCCDPAFFMTPERSARAAVGFVMAPLLIWAWPRRRGARILGGFVGALVLFFLAGLLARPLELYAFLKLFPCQLGVSLPFLFCFVLFLAHAGAWSAGRRFGRTAWILLILGMFAVVAGKDVTRELVQLPGELIRQLERPEWGESRRDAQLLTWIRTKTPPQSVFVTPFMRDFWPVGERAQVASMRHPPLDRRILEWKERLEALNGFRPFTKVGFNINDDMSAAESRLTLEQLVRIRDLYGATHYVTATRRDNLARGLLYESREWFVYDLTRLGSP
jgi:hypothetical protein